MVTPPENQRQHSKDINLDTSTAEHKAQFVAHLDFLLHDKSFSTQDRHIGHVLRNSENITKQQVLNFLRRHQTQAARIPYIEERYMRRQALKTILTIVNRPGQSHDLIEKLKSVNALGTSTSEILTLLDQLFDNRPQPTAPRLTDQSVYY